MGWWRCRTAPVVSVVAAALLLVQALVAAPARASATYFCTGYDRCNAAGYSDAGYHSVNSTSYWGMYPGHNCTNYAAYRLIQNGIDASYLRGQGMAYQWGTVAAGHGVAVDQNPRVGDIAWWAANSGGIGADGHVAYVEQVGNGYIVLSEDAFGGDFDWVKLTPGGYYPTAFIHFGGAPPPGGQGAAPAAGTYRKLAPARVLDTRNGIGVSAVRPVPARSVLRLQVTGVGGVPSSGVSAVLLNVTVAQPRAGGYVTVYPDGRAAPTVSNLNFVAGQVVPNLVLVPVGAGGVVDLFNGSWDGSTDLIADVEGYFLGGAPTAPGGLGTLTPARILDTRDGTGGRAGAVPARGVARLKVAGVGGVPASGVSAVVLNVTVADAWAAGYVTAYPDGGRVPTVSSLNFEAGQVVPNLVVVPVGGDGMVDLLNGSWGGSADLIADVDGYFLSGAPVPVGRFGALSPSRLLDTRNGTGVSAAAPVAARGTVRLKVTGVGGVPAGGVSAVVLNVTVVQPASGGYLTVFPHGSAAPTTSNLNFGPGQIVANAVVVPVGSDGTVDLLNGSWDGSTDVVADVDGYFS